jgi:hypothetical protein
MAHTGIFATANECKYKAGAKASSTATAEAYINAFCSQAESRINAECHHNYSDTYAVLNADVKYLLTEAASNLVGIYIVNYDMSGYSSLKEAQSIVDILMFNYNGCIKLLQQQLIKDFVDDA